ncbi:MAG: STAS domain-containing protein [Paracoccaceae bacterium]|nr:STAS domain-containing protein [Paracoccaceae bacterium]
MDLVSEERGGDLVVRVEEERIDAAIAVRFKDEMRVRLGGPHPRVILDLSRVDFLDSSGLGAVVAVLKEVGADQSFALAALTGNVEKVFRLTRMDTVFTIFPDVESAFGGVAHAS